VTAPAGERPADEVTRPATFRAGQVVTFRVRDVITEAEQFGHALVLRILGDVAHLAVLGAGGHAQVPVDQLAPAVLGDVPNPLPSPVDDPSA
jgi:hypothetical protein